MADNTGKWWIGLFCAMARRPHRTCISKVWSNFTVIFYGWEMFVFDVTGQWTLKIHVMCDRTQCTDGRQNGRNECTIASNFNSTTSMGREWRHKKHISKNKWSPIYRYCISEFVHSQNKWQFEMRKCITNSNKYYRNILCFMRLCVLLANSRLAMQTLRTDRFFCLRRFSNVAHHWTFRVFQYHKICHMMNVSSLFEWMMGK